MKKTLTISTNETSFNITDGTKEVNILRSDLILKGQDLYDNFYYDYKKEEEFNISINIDSSVIDSGDKKIVDGIKSILTEINSRLLALATNTETTPTREETSSKDNNVPESDLENL